MIIDPYTWYTAHITSIKRLAEGLVAISCPKPEAYSYAAGQYVIVRRNTGGRELLRQYSLTSSPQDDSLSLLIQREHEGVFSSWFHEDAKLGDTLEISAALGRFTVHDTSSPLFIAGRVGIAPFLSMAHDCDDPALLYAVRTESEIIPKSTMENTPRQVFVSENGERITQEVLSNYTKEHSSFYICGSKYFVDSIYEILKDLQVDESLVYRELFTLT